ncbi:MAG: FAD-dependent oxidoreductase [Bacteroidota bacterium]|nr:FAD-dependent oxidoreductase [Bacteroidota bacterium]MDP4260586.1 FAD-dependent oxidoreductase [Bacteroidota bacterium]
MEKTAIIGTGIAGMGCGYLLHRDTELSLFEQNDYPGGHTNTVTVDEDGRPVYVDMGFMVFNYQTYPNLGRLFGHLHAPVKKTDFSFSVQHRPTGLEYSGSSLNHLFAQRRNLLSPSFLKMLAEIGRFNRESVRLLDDRRYADYSLRQFIKEFEFGEDMLWKYLVPMSSAVWSAPMDKMLDFPAMTLIRFFHNHGFLGLSTQHQWWTLDKGSQSYRALLIAPFKDRIRLNSKVVRVFRSQGKAVVETANGDQALFDRVILACHADQALELLGDPTPDERRLLSCFSYHRNVAVLHTDASVMPRKKLAWSSWNYRIVEQNGVAVPSTIYWMNRLQQVSPNRNYFVSVNPQSDLDTSQIIRQIEYEHPLFDIPAIRAQKELGILNRDGPLYYCGSYFNYGFHEDAFTSAFQLCRALQGARSDQDLWKALGEGR